ncbi:MAG TPA: BON domain-containing protein [Moraxellaceae bacterium]|nr:BON domain-containing protein [Moraxellaceae bacterium]
MRLPRSTLPLLLSVLAAPALATAPDTAPRADTPPPAHAPYALRLAEGAAPAGRGAGAAIEDDAIIAEINSRMAGDPRLDGTSITVTAHQGSVVLSGKVDKDEARQAAEEIALQVEGVTQVDNRIDSPNAPDTMGERGREVLKESGQAASDTWITTKIRSSLMSDALTRSSNIGVKTIGGVVTLTGRVATQEEYDRILQTVRGIKGVKKVITTDLQAGGD